MTVITLSLGLGCIREFLAPASSICFIPNAGDVYDDPYFVREDLVRLERMGFLVEVIDLRKPIDPAVEILKSSDALFVAGGNTFYLKDIMQRSGFEEQLSNWIENDNIYIGASAGAVLLGPSLRPIIAIDDPAKAPGLENFNGLNIVDPIILPHYGKEKYEAKYQSIIQRYQSMYKLELLRDDEALIFTSRATYTRIKSEIVS